MTSPSVSSSPAPTPSHGKTASHVTGGALVPEPLKPVISPPNTVSLPSLINGCKVFVERPNEPDPRKAEILSMRTKKLSRAARRATLAENNAAANAMDVDGEKVEKVVQADELEYYVHYVEFNKRLDEWVIGTRILLSRPVEWPVAIQAPVATPSTPHQKKSATTSASSTPARETTPPPPPSSLLKKTASHEPGNLLRKAVATAGRGRRKAAVISTVNTNEEEVEDEMDADGEDDEEAANMIGGVVIEKKTSGITKEGEVVVGGGDGDEEMPDADADADADGEEEGEEDGEPVISTFSKVREIEKLRTQGSMTQSHSEVSRVKNLDKIQMGKHEVEAWYFSPYPIEMAHTPTLYICEFCLSFFASEKMIERHRIKCTLLHPPGNEIYRHEEISFFEIDGRKQKTWCRNLCLLSKCFLDHKTLYYDVDPFMYYVMCSRDDTGVHLIGYFSKEKESAENYNVACILTLPQYQRMGYGKVLIEFSYELSKKEGKLGSPEKPLSDLGLLSYRAYWSETIVELLLSTRDDISIEELASKTAIVHSDVMHTCQVLQMLKFSKGSHHLVVSEAVIEQHERVKKKGRKKIDSSKLLWRPPVFSRSDLRFGF